MKERIAKSLLIVVVTAALSACPKGADAADAAEPKPSGAATTEPAKPEPAKPAEGATGAAATAAIVAGDESAKLVDDLAQEIDADVAAEDG